MSHSRFFRFGVVAAFLAATFSMPALAKLTPAEAQTMPLQDLARRLLGEAGSLMSEVDRPRYKNVLSSIRFYSRPFAWGSYYGICASDWVTVEFDDNGNVDAIRAERRYGVAGDIYTLPGMWSYSTFESMCASVRSARDFFPAPDHGAAADIARFIDAIASSGPFAVQDYLFECRGHCRDGQDELQWLKLDEITSSRTIDCPKWQLSQRDCYEIEIGEGQIGLFPKTFRVYGSTYMNRTVISKVSVNVSATIP